MIATYNHIWEMLMSLRLLQSNKTTIINVQIMYGMMEWTIGQIDFKVDTRLNRKKTMRI